MRGGRTVLHGLDFTVPRGQVTGLLGPSGCGKSTLMRAIVGTQAKVTGTLEVLGSPAGAAPLRPRIGYVTQAPSVYADLTVRQNLEYFAAILDPGHAAADRRHENVTRAIADVDLTSHGDVLAGNLSGGQLSRVSLATALLGTPELLVLDEPTVGLDPVLRRDLWTLFHSLAEERHATLLISSHVMDEAERCHRLLLMRAGEILADDTPDGLRTHTRTDTVEAAFLHLVDLAANRTSATEPAEPAEAENPAPPHPDGSVPAGPDHPDSADAGAADHAAPTHPEPAYGARPQPSGADPTVTPRPPASDIRTAEPARHRDDHPESTAPPTPASPDGTPPGAPNSHPPAPTTPTTPSRARSAVSLPRTLATAARVLGQLRHDPRSIALMILAPCVMLTLLRFVFDGNERTFDSIGASLLGIFPLITMFLVTSIATLRERTTGTLERLLAMPLGKADLIGGYALAFGALAVLQSVLTTGVAVWALGLDVTGSPWLLLLIAVLDALLGTAIGLFVSAFATTEFQAIQFMPAVIFPQLLLCGLFAPRPSMHPALEAISDVLPMSYAVNGMNEILRHTSVTGDFVRDVLVMVGCALLVLGLGAATLRRRST
jgi:ABC transporter DrrB family efflux protein